MFWKKKQTATAPAGAGAAGAVPSMKVEVLPQPKAEMIKAVKLPGPRSVEEIVGRQIVVDLKQNPDWVWQLRSVVRQRTDGKHRFDFRVFDGAQVAEKKVKVRDFTSFDDHPEVVLYQGWFDKVSMEVHFEKKK